MWCAEAYQLSLVRAWYNLAVKQGFCWSQSSLKGFFIILKAIFFIVYIIVQWIFTVATPTNATGRQHFPHAVELGLSHVTCFGEGSVGITMEAESLNMPSPLNLTLELLTPLWEKHHLGSPCPFNWVFRINTEQAWSHGVKPSLCPLNHSQLQTHTCKNKFPLL